MGPLQGRGFNRPLSRWRDILNNCFIGKRIVKFRIDCPQSIEDMNFQKDGNLQRNVCDWHHLPCNIHFFAKILSFKNSYILQFVDYLYET
jgi:hypothetical protein